MSIGITYISEPWVGALIGLMFRLNLIELLPENILKMLIKYGKRLRRHYGAIFQTSISSPKKGIFL